MALCDDVSLPCLQAQDQLFHARRILGYSYVFAFFMFGQVMFADEITPAQNAINQNLFEDQQQQLEQVVRSCCDPPQHHDLRCTACTVIPLSMWLPPSFSWDCALAGVKVLDCHTCSNV